MIREIVRPKDNKLTINLPQEYVGEEIEYIIFPIKKHKPEKDVKEKNMDIGSLGGSLKQYANAQKAELENKAWELHVMDKYSK